MSYCTTSTPIESFYSIQLLHCFGFFQRHLNVMKVLYFLRSNDPRQDYTSTSQFSSTYDAAFLRENPSEAKTLVPRVFLFCLAVVFLLVLKGQGEEVAAEQFRYFDSAGSLHFESDWKNIPKEYRDEAAQNYYRSPQNHFPKQRATESLFEGPKYVPLRPPTVPRGSLRKVWRPRGGYSGIQTTRIP